MGSAAEDISGSFPPQIIAVEERKKRMEAVNLIANILEMAAALFVIVTIVRRWNK